MSIEVSTAVLCVLANLTHDIILALVLSSLLGSLSLLVLQSNLNGLTFFVKVYISNIATIES